MFYQFIQSPKYWVLMFISTLTAEAVALYYQYVLDDYPCVICIHIRIWVAALLLWSLLGFYLRRSDKGLLTACAGAFFIVIGLLERSYVLYGTEQGWVDGMCSYALNFPSWFAVDVWFPWIFEVQGACGYTPELIWGITMAQVLLVISVLGLIITLAALLISVKALLANRG